MKTYIWFVMMVGMVSACQILHTGDFANDTINLSAGCIRIIDDSTNSTTNITYSQYLYNISLTVNPEQTQTQNDTNISCTGNPVKQNNTITLLSGNSSTDNISNNTYVCSPGTFSWINTTISQNESYVSATRNVSVSCSIHSCMQNVSYTATFNETYRNNVTNINVTCPLYPSLNKNITLDYNESYTNSTLNFIIKARDVPKLNINKTLNYSETWTNETMNITIRAELYPKLNKTHTIAPNGTISFENLNLTVNASSCLQNISKNLSVGENFRSDICNITINAPSNASLRSNEVINLTYGSTKNDSKYNVTCIAPPRLDKTIYLDAGTPTSYLDSLNLSIQCAYSNYSGGINLAGLRQINANDTNCTRKEICTDMFYGACTSEEALAGDVYGCFDRIVNETQKNISIRDEQIADLQQQVQTWKNPVLLLDNIGDNLIQLVLLGMILATALAAIIVYLVQHAKKDKIGENILPPVKHSGRSMEAYQTHKANEVSKDVRNL